MKQLQKTTVLFAIILFIALQSINAQVHTISGVVINAMNSEPISGIDVAIKGISSTCKTTAKGQFLLQVPDTMKQIAFVEFKNMEITEIKYISDNEINIYLMNFDVNNVSIEDLTKVKVVTAGKKEQQISDIPASVVVINRNEIEKMGYLFLKDLIRNIPGYYAMNNLGINIFGVRGFVKDKGLNFVVLLNGVNITDDQILGFYDIPVQAIDKIEIIRGPMAVIYGDNAFFGAINIFTNTRKPKKFNHSISHMSGTNALINDFFSITGTKENLKYTINASYQKSDGYDFDITQMIKDPTRLNDGFNEGSNGNGLGVPANARSTKDKLNWIEKFISLNLSDEHFYTNMVYIEAMRNRYYYYPSLVDGSTSTTFKGSFSFGYKENILQNLSSDSKVTYDGLYRRNLYDLITPNFNGMETYRVSKIQFQSDLLWKPLKNVDISGGVEYSSILEHLNEGDVPQGGAPNYRYYNVHPNDQSRKLAFYAQAEYNFLNNFSLVAGVRFEKQFGYRILYHENLGIANDTIYEGKRDDGNIETYPRLALLYHINNNHVIKLLYGKAGKQPSVEVIGDDFFDHIGKFKPDYSKPEYITTYEINYNGKLSENIFVNASVFRNELNNLLIEKSFRYDPGVVKVIWTNRGQMKTVGFESTITSKFSSATQIELSAVYQKTNDLGLDTDASYSPNWLGYLKFYQPIAKGISISVLGNYIDGMKPHFNTAPYLDANGDPISQYIGRTSDDVSAYYTIDFNLKAEVPFTKFVSVFSLNIQNILNQEVRYPTFSINNAWADRGTLGYFRTVNFSVNFKF